MKILLTILFFADTLLLAGLSYWLLKAMDNAGNTWLLVALPIAMVISIFLLSFFLRRYIRLRSGKR
jgi:hypothetical protein